MYSGLLIALLPLIFGYLFPLKHPVILTRINTLLNGMVYIILFVMGISLAFMDNLTRSLLSIIHYTLVSFSCILLCNLLCLLLLEKCSPWQKWHQQEELPSRLHMALESLKLCGVLFAGFMVGLSQWPPLHFVSQGSQYILILLLFLIGLQLRNSGITLRTILFNRRGLLIASIVCLSTLMGGIVTALLLGMPLKMGLALSSGYGWYSLSGILMTEAFGPVIGSTAFFNDMMRELLAIMLIPVFMRRYRSVSLGLCGATSMDFTLPILQRSGGVEIAPAAIVHGFVLSLLAPILIAFFSA